jgi:hypothetical protein
MNAKKPKREPRNDKLKIELPFEEAIKAALETKPPAPKTSKGGSSGEP